MNALEMLASMNQQQAQQLMAVNLLAISVIMKKAGLQEITVSMDDFSILAPGETLEPIQNLDGGFTYRFVSPLAKKPVPKHITTHKRQKHPTKKAAK